MKQNNFYKGLMIMLTIIMVGCNKDLLESTPYAQATSANFWRNSDDAVSAANALYPLLGDEMFFGHPEQAWDICSDDQWRSGDWGNEQAIEDFTFDASNDQLGWNWSLKYEEISRANAIIINVPAIDMDTNLKNRILGEAYFIRGLMYWHFYKIYGQVPIITEENVISNTYNVPKATIEEMEARIESDLKDAAELLNAQTDGDNIGRPTKGAAWGYLAKLYLYKEDFPNAITYGNYVINGSYDLLDNFGDNFNPDIVDNSEMLFSIQRHRGWTEENMATWYYAPRPWDGWGFQEPTDDLYNEFEEGDPRLQATMASLGDMINPGPGGGAVEYVDGLNNTDHYFRKHAAFRSEGDGLDHDLDIPLLRSADIYLVVAEAKIRSSQSGDAEINAVRHRAGLGNVSGADMTDLIHERRVELAGENERHADLIRWDKAGIVDIVSHYAIDRGIWKPGRVFQRPKHYYFALPQRQIDLSNGILVQNPNYE
jgi:hypothetical protein